jgi:hydroxymethylbilane synthase
MPSWSRQVGIHAPSKIFPQVRSLAHLPSDEQLRLLNVILTSLSRNVGTRLSKLDAEDGPFDALILAAAGLTRLNLGDRISQYLDSENGNMLYAVGQGAVGVENRSHDPKIQEMLASITHQPTHLATTTERSLLRKLEGGCSAPLGVETSWLGDNVQLRLKAAVVSTDGKECSEIEMVDAVATLEQAESFGIRAAYSLLERGADKILAEIKAKKPTTVIDLEDK